MVMLHVGFLQQQQLQAFGWKMTPSIAHMFPQLLLFELQIVGHIFEAGLQILRRGAAQKVLLQEYILCWARHATCLDMSSTCSTVPVSFGYGFYCGTTQMERYITQIAYYTIAALPFELLLAPSTWCSFQQHLAWPLKSCVRQVFIPRLYVH